MDTDFENIIKNYLDNFARKDELFALKYKNSKKTIGECCNYIRHEAKEKAVKGVACIYYKQVYGWAIHFYEENESAPVEAETAHVVCTGSAPKTKKEKELELEKRQLSLFPDML